MEHSLVMDIQELRKYQEVQRIAKNTIDYLSSFIQEGVSESDISHAANEFMKNRGATSFWYHGVGSLVLVGRKTLLSISGREYKPSNDLVGRNDLVTVDLGPEIDSYWGDFARSFVIGNGRVVTEAKPDYPDTLKELFDGIGVEQRLHQKLQEIATPEMTFESLYIIMNEAIIHLGYVNLDFKGNLGHSIEKDKNDREYIERGCKTKLCDKLFTFEPHIKRANGSFGYKMEDIYYFSDGVLQKM
jgi:Xaa-Pro aminopeptidase